MIWVKTRVLQSPSLVLPHLEATKLCLVHHYVWNHFFTNYQTIALYFFSSVSILNFDQEAIFYLFVHLLMCSDAMRCQYGFSGLSFHVLNYRSCLPILEVFGHINTRYLRYTIISFFSKVYLMENPSSTSP